MASRDSDIRNVTGAVNSNSDYITDLITANESLKDEVRL